MSGSSRMRKAWSGTAAELGIPAQTARELLEEIEDAYGSPGRQYHNLEHLQRLTRDRNRLSSRFLRPHEILLAAGYHDFVYVPGASDNEERSARIAEDRLERAGLHTDIIGRVSFMIRATARHRVTGDGDTDLFLDMDMAILASRPREYRRYSEALRREYGGLSEEEYRTGRRRFLEDLAGRRRIFITGAFRGVPENAARRNIRNELKGLVPG